MHTHKISLALLTQSTKQIPKGCPDKHIIAEPQINNKIPYMYILLKTLGFMATYKAHRETTSHSEYHSWGMYIKYNNL